MSDPEDVTWNADHSYGRVDGVLFASELSFRISTFNTSRMNYFKGMSTCLLNPFRVKKIEFCYYRERRKTVSKIQFTIFGVFLG